MKCVNGQWSKRNGGMPVGNDRVYFVLFPEMGYHGNFVLTSLRNCKTTHMIACWWYIQSYNLMKLHKLWRKRRFPACIRVYECRIWMDTKRIYDDYRQIIKSFRGALQSQHTNHITEPYWNTFLLITRAPGRLQRRFSDQTKAQSVI